jgi:hypothetical protein
VIRRHSLVRTCPALKDTETFGGSSIAVLTLIVTIVGVAGAIAIFIAARANRRGHAEA